MAVSYNPRIVTDGLILYLDAANPRSYPGNGTTWYDLSGNRNHGTLTNGPTFSGINNGAIAFDGTDDYLISNVNGTTLSSFTVSFWVYNRGVASTQRGYFQWANALNATGPMLLITQEPTQSRFYIGGDYRISTNNVVMNQWTNISVTNNPSFWTIFINGNILTKLFLDKIYQGNALYAYLGNGYIGYSNALFSDLKIYNRELSPQDIEQNYNATKGRYGL